MLWRDVIELIPVTKQKNQYREEVDVDGLPKQVYANKKSIRQSEFYAAAAVGYKPEIVLEIQVIDYNEEPKLKHNGTTYHVIRTFSKNGERIELVCSRFPMGV